MDASLESDRALTRPPPLGLVPFWAKGIPPKLSTINARIKGNFWRSSGTTVEATDARSRGRWNPGGGLSVISSLLARDAATSRGLATFWLGRYG
jgi:hypothetical protein